MIFTHQEMYNIMETLPMLSTYQSAEIVGVARVTILKWIQRGHLPAVKVGRDYIIQRSDLDQCAATMRERKRGGKPTHTDKTTSQ